MTGINKPPPFDSLPGRQNFRKLHWRVALNKCEITSQKNGGGPGKKSEVFIVQRPFSAPAEPIKGRLFLPVPKTIEVTNCVVKILFFEYVNTDFFFLLATLSN